jgi:hypothetical protein
MSKRNEGDNDGKVFLSLVQFKSTTLIYVDLVEIKDRKEGELCMQQVLK